MSAPPLALRAVAPGEVAARCAICQTDLREGEQAGPCPECGAPFHGECWDEYGGCAVYGCALAPAPEAAAPAPASVWGQEERDCPGCGQRVRMAARRCRHCGRELSPAGAAAAPAGPGASVPVILLLLALLPTAPLALAAGGLWFRARRQDLRRGPPLARVLALAALVAAAAVTAVMIAGLALHLAKGDGGLEGER